MLNLPAELRDRLINQLEEYASWDLVEELKALTDGWISVDNRPTEEGQYLLLMTNGNYATDNLVKVLHSKSWIHTNWGDIVRWKCLRLESYSGVV